MNKKMIASVVATLAIAGGAAFAQEGQGGPGGFGGFGGRGGRGGDGAGLEIISTVTEATGLTLEQIRTGLQGGQTLGELIAAIGGNLDEVKASVIGAVTEAINQRVTEGKLTQERADEIIATLNSRVDEVLNSTQPIRDGVRPDGGRGNNAQSEVVDQLMIATEMTRAEIREAIVGGQTIADLLAAANVETETFIANVLAPVEENLTAKVTDGTITQAIADARLALYRLELEFRLTQTMEAVQ